MVYRTAHYSLDVCWMLNRYELERCRVQTRSAVYKEIAAVLSGPERYPAEAAAVRGSEQDFGPSR